MKKYICLILTIAGIAVGVTAPATSTAASTEGTVTGIGGGSFPGGSSFAGVNLSGFEIATGVITETDGSATGVFHADLAGRTVLGAARNITLEGIVTQGTATPGASSFSGLASLDLGNGLPAVSGVPFNVETRAGSMVLTIQATVLPSAPFSQGGMDIGP
jgi:hypothetical protein